MKHLKISKKEKKEIAEKLGLGVQEMCWDCLYCDSNGDCKNISKDLSRGIVSALDWNPDPNINLGDGIHFVFAHPLLLHLMPGENGSYLKIPIDRVEDPVLSPGIKGLVRAKGYHLSEKDKLEKKSKEFDQRVLEKIALFSKVHFIRIEAARLTKNQVVLKKIVKQDKSWEVREAAVRNINDQDFLAETAKGDNAWSVRKMAVRKIKSQAVLEWIAEKDDDWSVKALAIAKIKNQEAIIRVALNDKDWVVRLAAIKRIKNRKVLKEIAVSDSDGYIKKIARKLSRKILL